MVEDAEIPTESIETEKYKIKFLERTDSNNNPDYTKKFINIQIYIKDDRLDLDLQQLLHKDLKDLCKWGEYKKLKQDLEKEE